MPLEFVGQNVVVAAHHFNPTIFSQLWLVRNGLITEDSFRAGCAFTEAFSNSVSDEFSLLVVPPQLQFTPSVLPEAEPRLILEKVGAIVRALPHTPYHAIGLNFTWHVLPSEGSVATLSRRLFNLETKPLFREFSAADAQFGTYLSKDIFGTRLKLDIKPITVDLPELGGQQPRLHFGFNFHRDVRTDDPVTCIEEVLRNWQNAKTEAARLLGVCLSEEPV